MAFANKFMHGIGKQTSKKLRAMGINTIGELARFNQKTLFKVFGKTGIDMYARAMELMIHAFR